MSKKTILIIDDDRMVVRALRALLGEDRYTVYSADNGLQGVEEFDRLKPDVVLTDMEMPVMSGDKVIARIKAHYPFQVVLAMSSRTSNEFAAITAGATRFLKKPVMPMDVIPYIEGTI